MGQQTLNMVGINAQVQKLRHEQNLTNRLVRDMTAKFAYYWRDDRHRAFAIITRLDGSKADLVAFSNDWSGGQNIIDGAPMLVPDPDTPIEEIQKAGCWEPMWHLPDAINAAIELAAKKAAEIKVEVDETKEPAKPVLAPKQSAETELTEEENDDASLGGSTETATESTAATGS